MEPSTTFGEGGDDQFLDPFDMIFLAIDAASPDAMLVEDMMIEPFENSLMTPSSLSAPAPHGQHLSPTVSKLIGHEHANVAPTNLSIPYCTSRSLLPQEDDGMCEQHGSYRSISQFGIKKSVSALTIAGGDDVFDAVEGFPTYFTSAKAKAGSHSSCPVSKDVLSSCLHTGMVKKKAAPANAPSKERRIWGVSSRRRLDFTHKTMSAHMESLLSISDAENKENAMVPSLSDQECALVQHRESKYSCEVQPDLDTEKSRSLGSNLACKKEIISRNLVSERRRRRNLNDKLFSLRALVPNISKMDKASIVADAIKYVRDLQRQVEEETAEVSQLMATKEVPQHTSGNLDKNIINNNMKIFTSTNTKSFTNGNVININTDIILIGHNSDTDTDTNTNSIGLNSHLKCHSQPYQHIIVKIDLTSMEGQMYHVRLHCKNSHGVLVKLTRAIEALEVDIISANFSIVNDHILNTLIIKVKGDRSLLQDEVHQKVKETMLTYGFTFEL